MKFREKSRFYFGFYFNKIFIFVFEILAVLYKIVYVVSVPWHEISSLSVECTCRRIACHRLRSVVGYIWINDTNNLTLIMPLIFKVLLFLPSKVRLIYSFKLGTFRNIIKKFHYFENRTFLTYKVTSVLFIIPLSIYV